MSLKQLPMTEVEWGEGGEDDSAAGAFFKCVSFVGFRSLNSQMASSAEISSLLTHSLSESGYPFHLTRYCSFRPLPVRRELMTRSISYSSCPSVSSGTGRL